MDRGVGDRQVVFVSAVLIAIALGATVLALTLQDVAGRNIFTVAAGPLSAIAAVLAFFYLRKPRQ